MKINTDLAQNIVENLKNTIEQDINFMDQDGIIIASTNPNRIDSVHNGAKACIEKNEIVEILYDDQYPGAKKGVNLPVKFQHKTIGVIGISGELESVKKYGNIIRKMTEILVREEWIKENQSMELENKKLVVESILNSNIYSLDFLPKNLNSASKYIAVTKMDTSSIDFSTKRNLIKYIESNFIEDKVFTSIMHDRLIIIYLDSSYEEINDHIELIVNQANKSYKINLNFGISNKFYNINNSREYYGQALRAQKWSEYNDKKGPILFYRNMELGLILTSLEEKDLYEFSYKVLKDIGSDDLKLYSDLFFLYGKHNGSITKIANEIYMHKNTIQYRLNRLTEITGYDSRNYNDYVVLWFAFFALRDELN